MLAFTNERLFEPKPCSLCGSVSEVTRAGRGPHTERQGQHREILRRTLLAYVVTECSDYRTSTVAHISIHQRSKMAGRGGQDGHTGVG
jgi:hypothetical protein